jgi:hypothetical protein
MKPEFTSTFLPGIGCGQLRRWAYTMVALACMTALASTVALAQTWQTEIVDSGHDVGQFSALAIDHHDDLHVSYWDATADAPRGLLIYAFRAQGDKKWSRIAVDQDGTYVSMALDSKDRPHLAYNSKRENGLHYTYWNGKKFVRQVIDSEHINYYTSIQVDSQDHPCISYYLYHAPTGEYVLNLKYAYYDGKAWFIQTVDRRMHTGKMNALALDAKGNPHISYSYLGSSGDMLYAYWADARWQLSAADFGRTENTHLSYGNNIAVDSKGVVHLVYFDNVKNNVKYASWDGSHWTKEVVDHVVALDDLDHIALQIDKQDHPHLAYYDAGAGALKYAILVDSKWETEVVPQQGGNSGLRPSLALDSHGNPYILSYGLTDHALHLAHRVAKPPVKEAAKPGVNDSSKSSVNEAAKQ